MENFTDEDIQIESLKRCLNSLVDEYKDARELINDQVQAVVYHDLIWLNSLIDKQMDKYDSLKKLEEEFKEELTSIFRFYEITENHHSLSNLLEKLQVPSAELNELRKELREQVEKTQMLRKELMDLLVFASRHNTEMFEGIFHMGSESGDLYDNEGKKQGHALNSIAFNRKA